MERQQEILHLAQLLNRSLPENWAALLTRFADAWPNYLEYQITLDSREFSLITLGRDAQFLDKIADLLQEMDSDEASLLVFQNMRRYVGPATWGLKLLLDDKPEAQVYVKKPLPLPELLFWLRQRQAVNDAACQTIETIAAILQKTHTHFVGADFTPGQPIRYQIYFTQYLAAEEPVQERVRQTIATLGLNDAARQKFERYHPILAQPEQTLWLSLGLANEQIIPSLKLDYAGVRLGVVNLLAEDLNLATEETAWLQKLGEQLQVDTADYLGLRLANDRSPQVSVYLTRQCA